MITSLMEDLTMEKKIVLIVVDVQNDFVTGALRNEDAIKTIPNVLAKVREYNHHDLIEVSRMDSAEAELNGTSIHKRVN